MTVHSTLIFILDAGYDGESISLPWGSSYECEVYHIVDDKFILINGIQMKERRTYTPIGMVVIRAAPE